MLINEVLRRPPLNLCQYPSSTPSGWWRRASGLRWAASATVMTTLSPRRSTVFTRHIGAGAMVVITSRRVRDAGIGGLVQQRRLFGTHRPHPAGRSRATLLRHAGRISHGSTQIKWPSTNPGRFIAHVPPPMSPRFESTSAPQLTKRARNPLERRRSARGPLEFLDRRRRTARSTSPGAGFG